MTCGADEYQRACDALPYEASYKFVDRVIESDCKRWIIAEKRYELDDLIIDAHRRVGGCVPGTVLIEQAAQSSLVLGILGDPACANRIALFAQVKAKFIVPVKAPATVLAEIAIKYQDQRSIGFSGKLRCDDTVHAMITGVCAFLDDVE